MNSNISNYYCLTYTSELNNNLIDSNIIDLDKIYALKCSSKKVISFLLNKLLDFYTNENYSLEIIHNPIDNTLLQGIINNNLRIGIFDEEALDKIFNTTVFINLEDAVKTNTANINIEKSKAQIKDTLSKACEHFAEAKKIHDEWEEVYIKHINFSEADELAKSVCEGIFDNYEDDIIFSSSDEDVSKIKARFFGAVSAGGAQNYVSEILQNYDNIYYIKGRPGTCKSTIMKTIANRAQEYGFDLNIYNCASDVNSVDMICIENISTCIFDSTAPHEFFPTNDSDVVIDTYAELLPENFDEDHIEEINDIKSRYQIQVSKGIAELGRAKSLIMDIEDNIQIINFDKLFDIYEAIKAQE